MLTALSLAHRARLIVESIARAMALVAGWSFLATAVFISVDVVCRAFLGFSSGATTEISGYLMAFGLSWSLAHALAERAHIRIDLLVMKMPLGLRVWMHLAALLLLLALVAILCWSAVNVLEETLLWNARDISALRIPLIWPQGIWAFGLGALAVFAAALTLEIVLLLAARRPDDIDAMMRPRSADDDTEETILALNEAPHADPEDRP
ncbi:MAG: TRAP transporter small permease [Rhodobacteraceae bacterium]|jgi:TRAP-type C4-dicarboxylate transport system permease small subunit|uniref:TRAP transporter small permease protein n=1 Tax=Salipiger profundus TaxID=1229727 RepID=A0A1U7D8Q8_9RHOB|nr:MULTISPECIES: TRAP transporter small permease [Salipiger]APX24492.1 TRAP-type C4-dicarboxylate transport system, small permease component [Salipiger profundus]MAB07208.1 TRAP transporter small permease [Paracoccaceae bacterium]GGA18878.1 C4-dicarboxylate ABC transporter permease [Salipiger profundus]SFD40246.1 TRAP-type C4-dicarboxylate transport system, small permease component [Salipiger profundus]